MKYIVIVALTLLSTLSAFACSEDGKTGIAPDNNLKISVNSFLANEEMTEEKFNEVIDSVEKIYAPIIASDHKARLSIERGWDDGTVNAYASRSSDENGPIYKVKMFGGLARHIETTPDGFALVVCHEIGHHIGGAPKKTDWQGNLRWASNEGQSDYWGSLKCLRRVWVGENNPEIVKSLKVPSKIWNKCESTFSNEDEKAICKRAAMAGLSLARLLGSLRGNADVDFDTPDTKVVSSTNHNHPAAQCRLDTYYAGAVCAVDFNTRVDRVDANIGTCNRAAEMTLGLRPLCWFKPSLEDDQDSEEEEESILLSLAK